MSTAKYLFVSISSLLLSGLPVAPEACAADAPYGPATQAAAAAAACCTDPTDNSLQDC